MYKTMNPPGVIARLVMDSHVPLSSLQPILRLSKTLNQPINVRGFIARLAPDSHVPRTRRSVGTHPYARPVNPSGVFALLILDYTTFSYPYAPSRPPAAILFATFSYLRPLSAPPSSKQKQSTIQGSSHDLYWSVGDGGPQNDPFGRAQDANEFHGSMMRISVSADADGYAIPSDNPFAGGGETVRGYFLFLFLRGIFSDKSPSTFFRSPNLFLVSVCCSRFLYLLVFLV